VVLVFARRLNTQRNGGPEGRRELEKKAKGLVGDKESHLD